jgi:hypothetical protein
MPGNSNNNSSFVLSLDLIEMIYNESGRSNIIVGAVKGEDRQLEVQTKLRQIG